MEAYGLLDKWLHHDKGLSRGVVARLLGIDTMTYVMGLKEPWRVFSVIHMEKLAGLSGKGLLTIFWACWKRPIGEYRDDDDLRRINLLERLGLSSED